MIRPRFAAPLADEQALGEAVQPALLASEHGPLQARLDGPLRALRSVGGLEENADRLLAHLEQGAGPLALVSLQGRPRREAPAGPFKWKLTKPVDPGASQPRCSTD